MRGSSSDLPRTVDVDELTIREADWGDIRVSIIVCHKTLDIAPLLKDCLRTFASAPTGARF